jgi:putative endonuclease
VDVRRAVGRWGEDIAADLYRRQGFDIVARNVRTRLGEIDLVARRGGTLVFCEVKTRKTDRWEEPAQAVGWDKQRRLRRLARNYLDAENPGVRRVRFDVVSIVAGPDGAEVAHVPDAF